MPLNEHQVDYDNRVTEPAREYRTQLAQYPDLFGNMGLGGRCVAYLMLDNGGWMAQMSESSLVRGVGLGYALHAEQVLIQMYNAEPAGTRRPVSFVYTELQCGGPGSGMRNCQRTMEQFLQLHGVSGIQTPVYYTLPYPSGDATLNKGIRKNSIVQLKRAAEGR